MNGMRKKLILAIIIEVQNCLTKTIEYTNFNSENIILLFRTSIAETEEIKNY